MSGYNVEYFIADFSKRTSTNLGVIEKESAYNTELTKHVFEVTQLINSMFGIIIVTFEAIKPFRDIKKKDDTIAAINSKESKLKIADNSAYERLLLFINDLKEKKRYFNSYTFDKELGNHRLILFIEHIRNALAHGGDTGLHFHPIRKCEHEQDMITSVLFEDTNPENKEEKFIVELMIDEIKELLSLLCQIIQKRPNIDKAKSSITKYDKRIELLRSFMRSI